MDKKTEYKQLYKELSIEWYYIEDLGINTKNYTIIRNVYRQNRERRRTPDGKIYT